MLEVFLVDVPICKKKVRKGVFAYKYPNGVIQIETDKYFFYSMTDAIKQWVKKYPKYKK